MNVDVNQLFSVIGRQYVELELLRAAQQTTQEELNVTKNLVQHLNDKILELTADKKPDAEKQA